MRGAIWQNIKIGLKSFFIAYTIVFFVHGVEASARLMTGCEGKGSRGCSTLNITSLQEVIEHPVLIIFFIFAYVVLLFFLPVLFVIYPGSPWVVAAMPYLTLWAILFVLFYLIFFFINYKK
jgi:hypothetical protein